MSGTVLFFILFLLLFIALSFVWGWFGVKTCDTTKTVKYVFHTVVYLLFSLFIENLLWKIEGMPIGSEYSKSYRVFIGKLFFLCELVFGLSAIMAVCQNLINYFKGNSKH